MTTPAPPNGATQDRLPVSGGDAALAFAVREAQRVLIKAGHVQPSRRFAMRVAREFAEATAADRRTHERFLAWCQRLMEDRPNRYKYATDLDALEATA